MVNQAGSSTSQLTKRKRRRRVGNWGLVFFDGFLIFPVKKKLLHLSLLWERGP
jgi:hypothetical protein